jgi:hypothetical protein
VDDGADPVAVGESELMEDESLAGVEADAERPLLPVDAVAVDDEAGALGLGDLDGLLGGAQGAGDGEVVEVAGFLGRSRTSVTVRFMTSTNPTSPSIGWAQAWSLGWSWRNASPRRIRLPVSPG